MRMGFHQPVLLICTLLSTGYVAAQSEIEAFDELGSLGSVIGFPNLDDDPLGGDPLTDGEDPLSGGDPLLPGGGGTGIPDRGGSGGGRGGGRGGGGGGDPLLGGGGGLAFLGDPQTAEEVMLKLKPRGITPDKLFAIRNKAGIKVRSDLEHLGKWMNGEIETAFQDKNPKVVYELLGRCADLLQIANVGCLNERCSTPVLEIHSKYQDMMYKASKISYDGILTTIELMKYFRYAIRKPKKYRMRILAQTVRFTKKFARSYRQLSDMAEELRNLSVTAFTKTNVIRQDVVDKIKQIDKDYRNITIELSGQKERKKQLMENVKDAVEEIKKIEARRNNFLQKYMKLINTPVKDTTECIDALIPQFKIVTTEIKNYVKIDDYVKDCKVLNVVLMNHVKTIHNDKAGKYVLKGQMNGKNYWVHSGSNGLYGLWHDIRPPWKDWNIGRLEYVGSGRVSLYSRVTAGNAWNGNNRWLYKDGYFKKAYWTDVRVACDEFTSKYREEIQYNKTSMRISDKLDRKCWKKKDRVHLDKLTHDMNAIQKQLNKTRPRYIRLLERLATTKREKIDVFEIVAKNMVKLAIFNDTKTEDEKVAATLRLVIDSLKVVKTIMAEAEEFWERQADFITKKLQKRSTPGISDEGALGEFGDDEGLTPEPENSFLEIGLNWMIFGKLSVLAYEENERNKDKVNEGLLTHMSPERTKQVMASARTTIDEIQELRKTIRKKSEITQSKMDAALLKIHRNYRGPAAPLPIADNNNSNNNNNNNNNDDDDLDLELDLDLGDK